MSYDRETLVAELRERGVAYLAPSDALSVDPPPTDEALLLALLDQPDSRLRMGLVPLLIRHPALAGDVERLAARLDPSLRLQLQTYYQAAVYLQRLWRSRLGFYLDTSSLLPDLYSAEMGLPPAHERHGKVGLYELADAWQTRSPYPFDRLAEMNQTIEHFFGQLTLEGVRPEYA
ncbi:MAG: hypothetical protein HY328_08600 [Chloroflexi bacterium]|nr:hypothetical protein [Chloroflexota bacterium]